MENNIFHTKHDFSPELSWSAFQLLGEVGEEGITARELHSIAELTASPLVVRSDLNKLLAGMHDVGLIERNHDKVALSAMGRLLSRGSGRYQTGFYSAVHCLYSWRWLWIGDTNTASPSWSYREVCKHLLRVGKDGITTDDLVLRIVTSAERFSASKISFSRSSLNGVLMWLEAQTPPLIRRERSYVLPCGHSSFTPGMVRLHLAALCRLYRGEAYIDQERAELLSESLLVPPVDLAAHLLSISKDLKGFLVISEPTPRFIFTHSEDPFFQWIGAFQYDPTKV